MHVRNREKVSPMFQATQEQPSNRVAACTVDAVHRRRPPPWHGRGVQTPIGSRWCTSADEPFSSATTVHGTPASSQDARPTALPSPTSRRPVPAPTRKSRYGRHEPWLLDGQNHTAFRGRVTATRTSTPASRDDKASASAWRTPQELLVGVVCGQNVCTDPAAVTHRVPVALRPLTHRSKVPARLGPR